jgi:signal transduction histidine kinase
MDRLFDEMVGAGPAAGAQVLATMNGGYLPLDVCATDAGLVVRLCMPGHDPETLQLTCEGSMIRIRHQIEAPEGAPNDGHFADGFLDQPVRLIMPQPNQAIDLGLDDAKLHFLLRVSEELRQPITLLAGYMDMINQGTISDPRDVVPILIRKTAELNALVTNLLERARAEAW